MIAPIFEKLSHDNADAVFVKVDVDALEDVSAQYHIEAMPTFVFLKAGAEVKRIQGANKDAIIGAVASLK